MCVTVMAAVFCGPTITASEVAVRLNARCFPPVSQGDVHRAVSAGYRWIAVIDGYFRSVPAVWHKEILWALSQGVQVYGAASMGALRAAELRSFGMHGVGRIFLEYASANIEDDDEVAVLHGPADSDYICLSEAMVNIRFTLRAARDVGMIDDGLLAGLLSMAKATNYTRRSWPQLLRDARRAGVPEVTIDALDVWLRTNAINQKKLDALEALDRMARDLAGAGTPLPAAPGFAFEPTVLWHNAVRAAADMHNEAGAGVSWVMEDGILDEVRLDPELYWYAVDGVLLRHLVRDASRRTRDPCSGGEPFVQAELMRALGITSESDLQEWIRLNDSSREGFLEIARDEALLEACRQRMRTYLENRIPDFLRSRGRFAQLARRAARKRSLVDLAELDRPSLPPVEDLVAWHLARLNPTRAAHEGARRSIRGEAVEYLRAVMREYVYCHSVDGEPGTADEARATAMRGPE